MKTPSGTRITIRRPDDFHVHFRDGQMLKTVAPLTAKHFARAIIMPNLIPPVVSVKSAMEYRDRIVKSTGKKFTPLMTLYLTDNLKPSEIIRAKNSNGIFAVKLYPAGATTNSAHGVSKLEKVFKAFETMEKNDMVLCIHGEVTDASVDIFDREKVFIETQLKVIVKKFPKLRIVLEHITTGDAVRYINQAPKNIAATITAQHLLMNRNDMLANGIKPHLYCKPILKAEVHRLGLVKAATSGSPKFFAGTDSAPHSKSAKESACGCAGCFTAPSAVALYAQAFDDAGMWNGKTLKNFEKFMSMNGAEFYGLPLNSGTLTLTKKSQVIKKSISFGKESIIPFMAGESISWKA
jgi:dihydroorotase